MISHVFLNNHVEERIYMFNLVSRVFMESNVDDICVWMRRPSTIVDRQGLLLLRIDDAVEPLTVQVFICAIFFV